MTPWQQLLLVIALVLMVLDAFSLVVHPRLKPGWLGVAIVVIVWAMMHMPKG